MKTLTTRLLLFTLTLAPGAFCVTNTLFSVLGSVNTFALAINNSGDIAGSWTDSSGLYHGYLRYADGSYMTFDIPGAIDFSVSLNDQRQIAGSWYNEPIPLNPVYHAYTVSSSGVVSTFEVPGSIGTVSAFISNNGSIAGHYLLTETLPFQGYILSPEGQYTTFSLTDNIVVTGINASGDVAGVAGSSGSFVRHADGTFVTHPSARPADQPRDGFPIIGLYVQQAGINLSGQVPGVTDTQISNFPKLGDERNIYTPFLWSSATKNFDRFSVSSPSVPPQVTGINDAGEVIGFIWVNGVQSGFVRTPNGTITTFTVGSVATAASSINNQNVICGSTITADNPAYQGFFQVP